MKRHYFWLLSLLTITTLAACNKKDSPGAAYDPAKQAIIDEQLIQEHFTKNNITGTLKDTANGLHYKIIEPGNGVDTIQLNDRFNITYEGKLLNGNRFDGAEKTTLYDSRLEGLIQGWQIGLRKISKGGKIHLYIPSTLGYKNFPQGEDIPANSVLFFEITLHNFYF